MLVVGTSSGRVDCIEATMLSWSQAHGIDHARMVWFLEPSAGPAAREAFLDFAPCPITIVQNQEQMGLCGNTLQALMRLEREGDFGVMAEDDVEVASDVLEYMRWCASRYVLDPQVMMVCAQNDWLGEQHWALLDRVSRVNRFHPQVWGTWPSRVATIAKYLTDYDGKSWDWSLQQQLLRGQDKVAIAPFWSRSRHIGESGAHCTPDLFPSTRCKNFAGPVMLPGPFVEV